MILVGDSGMTMPTVSCECIPCSALNGGMKNASRLTELCTPLDTHYSNMMQKIVCFIRQTAADDWQLPVDPAQWVYFL